MGGTLVLAELQQAVLQAVQGSLVAQVVELQAGEEVELLVSQGHQQETGLGPGRRVFALGEDETEGGDVGVGHVELGSLERVGVEEEALGRRGGSGEDVLEVGGVAEFVHGQTADQVAVEERVQQGPVSVVLQQSQGTHHQQVVGHQTGFQALIELAHCLQDGQVLPRPVQEVFQRTEEAPHHLLVEQQGAGSLLA